MNTAAYDENLRNAAYIERYEAGETLTYVIATHGVSYRGIPWRALGAFGRRKFENLLALSAPRMRLQFVYA